MDWNYLNGCRVKTGLYASTPECGFNGAFWCKIHNLLCRIVASDGMGWQHVSVSIAGSVIPPSWSIMSQVKDLFWDAEDTVMQLHPPRSLHVNYHPGCLHLWRPTDEGVTIPMPMPIMVGPLNVKGPYEQFGAATGSGEA